MSRHLQAACRTLAHGLMLPWRVCLSGRNIGKSRSGSVASVGFGALLAITATAAILTTLEVPRNALWAVVRTCVAMSDRFGTPFPCLSVKTGPQGFAVLRAPGSKTHLIVTPIVPLSGLENPVLWSSPTPYWQAALDVRILVIEGLSARHCQLGDVALAINSRRSRSQDHLHIHADCAAPQLLQNVRFGAAAIGPDWTPLPYPIEDATYWARRVLGNSNAGKNAFLSLRELPNDMLPGNVTIGAINLSADGNGDFVQLVSDDAVSSAEDLLVISYTSGSPR